MSPRINILSLFMLIVYGALTLVAVPLHQHPVNYLDSPQYQSVVSHYSTECGVCTFAFHSFNHSHLIVIECSIRNDSERISAADAAANYTSLLSKEYPRRGPPAFLS